MMAGLAVVIMLAMAGCTGAQQSVPAGKLKVVASFYPIYDYAKNVGGERIEASMLIPSGVEPHEFEPSVSDIRSISEADVFIYNGADMEPWADRVVGGAGNENLTLVDTSRGIALLESGAGHEHHHETAEAGEDEHGGHDPHFWLDPNLAKIQVANIRDGLIAADPEGKQYYEKNAAAYMAKLDSLDSRISAAMSGCAKQEFLVTHATMGYFCARYGCEQVAITGVDPEAEPSPADLAAIIDQAREHGINAVFVESMMDPRSATTISNEIGGTVLTLNSVHGLTAEEAASGEDYISLMDANLANIKKGLDCG